MPGYIVSVFMAPTVRPEGTGMTVYSSVTGKSSYERFVADPLWSRGLLMNAMSSVDAMYICHRNPHRLDHKGIGVKVVAIYVTITHTVSTTKALVSRLLLHIRFGTCICLHRRFIHRR